MMTPLQSRRRGARGREVKACVTVCGQVVDTTQPPAELLPIIQEIGYHVFWAGRERVSKPRQGDAGVNGRSLG